MPYKRGQEYTSTGLTTDERKAGSIAITSLLCAVPW